MEDKEHIRGELTAGENSGFTDFSVDDIRKEAKAELKFEKVKEPNAETLAAMEELKNGGGTRYKNAEELFKALDIE